MSFCSNIIFCPYVLLFNIILCSYVLLFKYNLVSLCSNPGLPQLLITKPLILQIILKP